MGQARPRQSGHYSTVAEELRLTALMGVFGVPVLGLLLFGGRRTDRRAPDQPRLRRQLCIGFSVGGVLFVVLSLLLMASESSGGGPTFFWTGVTFLVIGYLNRWTRAT
jgi:hypothetical protein